MMTTRASSDSALAISTSWRCASESSATGVSGAEVGAEPIEQRRRRRRASAARSTRRNGPPKKRLAAEEDVGGDVEIVEEVEFLVDEGDAGGASPRRR